MKKIDPRLLLAVGLAGLVMAARLLLMGAVVWSTLDAAERAAVGDVLSPRVVLVAMGWLAGLAVVGGALQGLYRRYVGAPARLLEETRVVLTAATPLQLKPRGTAEMQALAVAVNELAAQRDGLRADMDAQVAQASYSVQQEKNRLAALMAELKAGGFAISQGALDMLRGTFASGRCSEEETVATIRAAYARTGEVLCPHSAVGVKVAEEHLGDVPMITLATAHPAKFPDAVEGAMGVRPALPTRMGDLYDRPERLTRVANDLAVLQATIRERIGR